jgi:hypothetical protein
VRRHISDLVYTVGKKSMVEVRGREAMRSSGLPVDVG